MSELQPRCLDCGRPIAQRSLCAACEQDRVMQQAELASRPPQGKGMRCND